MTSFLWILFLLCFPETPPKAEDTWGLDEFLRANRLFGSGNLVCFLLLCFVLWWEGEGKTLTASDFCLKVFFFPSQGFFKKDIFSKVDESWEGNRAVLEFFACCVLCSFFRTWERFLEPPKNHSIVSDQEAMRFLIGIIDRWKSLRYLKLTLVQDVRCLSTMSFHASTLRCGHHPTKSGFIGQMAKLGLLVSLLLVAAWCQGW